jgi:hypothetical protein
MTPDENAKEEKKYRMVLLEKWRTKKLTKAEMTIAILRGWVSEWERDKRGKWTYGGGWDCE